MFAGLLEPGVLARLLWGHSRGLVDVRRGLSCPKGWGATPAPRPLPSAPLDGQNSTWRVLGARDPHRLRDCRLSGPSCGGGWVNTSSRLSTLPGVTAWLQGRSQLLQ